MKRIKRLWWVLPALLILAGVGFLLWASGSATLMPEALAALESDARVHVETSPAGMSANYCRCGAYGRIKRAVGRAAAEMAAAENPALGGGAA
jgi:hypothetical protein